MSQKEYYGKKLPIAWIVDSISSNESLGSRLGRDFQDLAILAGFNSTWEMLRQPVPVHVGAHMSQDCPPRPDTSDPGQHAVQPRMRVVWRALVATDDPGIDSIEHIERRIIEVDHIRRIAEAADAQAKRVDEAMVLIEQTQRQASDLDDVTGADRSRYKNRAKKSFMVPRSERVFKAMSDLIQRRLGAVSIQWPVYDAV